MAPDNKTTAPMVTGQCAQVLNLIRDMQPVPSLEISIVHAIPELAARVHDLRAKGFNIVSVILPAYEFRGKFRRNVAKYSLASPEWPRPGFLDGHPVAGQIELDLDQGAAQ